MGCVAPLLQDRNCDDNRVTCDESAAWVKVAGREFEHVEVAGGHMYLVDSAEALLRLVISTMG